MALIHLTDKIGLDLEIQSNGKSAFNKYFQNIPALLVQGARLGDLGGFSIDNPAITDLQTTFQVSEPVPAVLSGIGLTIKAGLTGSIGIVVPDPDLPAETTDSLFAADEFGEDIPIAKDERYVSAGFTTTAGPQAAAAVSDLSFGFAANTDFSVTNYQKFRVSGAVPSVADAVKTTFGRFIIPADVSDLDAMAPDSIVSLSGSGTLKFSAQASLAAAPNPLATVNLGPVLPSISVADGGSVTVGASFTHSLEYEIRARKTSTGTIRLGYFKKKGSEIGVSVDAEAGVSAGFGQFDLFEKLVTAISPSAQADIKELKAAGVDDATRGAIEATVKAGVQRTLEIGMTAEWDTATTNKAAFLYEINVPALNDNGRKAVNAALCGDLSDLIASDSNPQPGITMKTSIFTRIREREHSLKINLLGIYNFISVSKLTLNGRVLFHPESGELTITDTATSSKIQAGAVNVGGKANHADPDQVRKVLASSFLITATYRASGSVVTPPALKSAQTYFHLQNRTSASDLRQGLNLPIGLRLMTVQERDAIVQGADSFGRTMLYARTQYGDDLTRRMFLNGETPLGADFYESIGRQAMQIAVREGDDDPRLKPLQSDDLWKEMKRLGQPSFGQIQEFRRLNANQLGAITTDYTVIVWWADAMQKAAAKMAAVRRAIAQNMDVHSAEFNRLRSDLADHLRDVAAHTHDEFGKPWGIIVMDMATGSASDASVVCSGPRLTVSKSRQAALMAS
jgi:hypothetical protein